MNYPMSNFLHTTATPTSDHKISWSPKHREKHPPNNLSGDNYGPEKRLPC
jgi:hypothetical protein